MSARGREGERGGRGRDTEREGNQSDAGVERGCVQIVLLLTGG